MLYTTWGNFVRLLKQTWKMVPGPSLPQCSCGKPVHLGYESCIEEHPLVGEVISWMMASLYGDRHQDGKKRLDPDSQDQPQEYQSCMLKSVKRLSGHTWVCWKSRMTPQIEEYLPFPLMEEHDLKKPFFGSREGMDESKQQAIGDPSAGKNSNEFHPS